MNIWVFFNLGFEILIGIKDDLEFKMYKTISQ